MPRSAYWFLNMKSTRRKKVESNSEDKLSGKKYDLGMRIFREVMGSKMYERHIKSINDFNRPLWKIIMEYNWATIWARPGLSRKTRSLIDIALMAALNRPDNLKNQTRGALENGCTKQEIAETLLQTMCYAGGPAGVNGFRIAEQSIEAYEKEKRSARRKRYSK